MTDTTCVYNKVHGTFNRREIRMVAQALSLPEERIDNRLNKLGIGETIQTTNFINLIEKGSFAMDFNYVYNNQSGRYNSLILVKGLKLVDAHLFSFNELLKARLAFNMYEMNISSDYQKNLKLVLQTIKFCDRHISVLKLERFLYHYGLSGSKILHLCEFLDLLLVCNRDNKNSKLSLMKPISLSDPKPRDQVMGEELDKDYLRDERNWFFKEKVDKQKVVEYSVWPARLAHQYQMNLAAIRKVQLQRVLSASRSSLQQVRAGSSATSYQSRQFSSSLGQSIPISECSSLSRTTRISPGRAYSRPTSDESEITDIEKLSETTKPSENLSRIEQLRTDSALLTIKYALYREDYMNELLPEGYTKPLVLPKPVERRLKKSRSVVHYSQRAKMKKH